MNTLQQRTQSPCFKNANREGKSSRSEHTHSNHYYSPISTRTPTSSSSLPVSSSVSFCLRSYKCKTCMLTILCIAIFVVVSHVHTRNITELLVDPKVPSLSSSSSIPSLEEGEIEKQKLLTFTKSNNCTFQKPYIIVTK